MANPFFRSYGRSSYPYSSYPFYHHPHPSSQSSIGVPITSQPMSAPSQKPRVISIPVQFINANQPKPEPKKTRSESATKIQKVWRGFCVRRSLKKVQEIRRQVDEVERKISDETTAKMISTDEKERLKVNETLMSLLFRLDSIRSSEGAVKDLRKAAIRRAIALQEKVDSMAISDANHVENTDQIEDEGDGGDDEDNVEDGMVDSGEEEEEGKLMQQENNLGAEDADVTARDVGVDGGCEEIQREQLENRGESFATLGEIVYPSDQADDEIPSRRDPEPMEVSNSDEDREKAALVPVGEEIPETTKVEGFRSSVSCISGGSFERDEEKNLDQEEHEENNLDQEESEQRGEKSEQEDVRHEEADVSVAAKRPRNGEWSGECSERNRELLERMAEDNERMMTLMAELFERNEAQTRILSSLSQRVEQLENAFLRDKLRRNKKKKKNATKLVKAKYGTDDRLV